MKRAWHERRGGFWAEESSMGLVVARSAHFNVGAGFERVSPTRTWRFAGTTSAVREEA